MKTFAKTILTTSIALSCLIGTTACANKSECKVQSEPDTQTSETQILPSDGPECPDCPVQPENPECPDCPDDPDCPKLPDEEKKDGKPKRCPYPIRRGTRIKLMPFEIIYEQTEDGFYYVFLPVYN